MACSCFDACFFDMMLVIVLMDVSVFDVWCFSDACVVIMPMLALVHVIVLMVCYCSDV